jgi:dihydroneopterin aldolase
MESSLIITGLQTYGYHGLVAEERQLGQKFLFGVRATLASAHTHLDDGLEASVRYELLIEEIERISDAAKFRTLEALGETVARTLLDRFGRIRSVTVVVSKASPPMPQTIGSVSVEISLERQ